MRGADTKLTGYLRATRSFLRGCAYASQVLGRELGPSPCGQRTIDVRPSSAGTGVMDRRVRHAKFPGEAQTALALSGAAAHVPNVVVGEACVWGPHSSGYVPTVRVGMPDVVAGRHVLKVGVMVVLAVAVLMIHLFSGRARADERGGHEAVNKKVAGPVVLPKTDLCVSAGHLHFSGQPARVAHEPAVRDFISTFKPGNRLPSFSHSGLRFCYRAYCTDMGARVQRNLFIAARGGFSYYSNYNGHDFSG